MVYGSGGVTALTRDHQRIELSSSGVFGRSSVAGGNSEHVYMDSYGDLWRVTPNPLTATKLGYGHILSSMKAGQMRMLFDEHEGDYYISDNTIGYMLTQKGLTVINERPTSIANVNGVGLVGPSEGASDTFKLTIGDIDVDFYGLKKFTTIQVIYREIDDLRMVPSVKYDRNGVYIACDEIYGTDDGLFFIGVQGIQLKFAIQGTLTSQNSTIDKIIVRYQYVDGRGTRGPRGAG